jgi:hypothetical protein
MCIIARAQRIRDATVPYHRAHEKPAEAGYGFSLWSASDHQFGLALSRIINLLLSIFYFDSGVGGKG